MAELMNEDQIHSVRAAMYDAADIRDNWVLVIGAPAQVVSSVLEEMKLPEMIVSLVKQRITLSNGSTIVCMDTPTHKGFDRLRSSELGTVVVLCSISNVERGLLLSRLRLPAASGQRRYLEPLEGRIYSTA